MLRARRRDEYQGYLTSRPVDAVEFETLAAQHDGQRRAGAGAGLGGHCTAAARQASAVTSAAA
ncbi:MAG: hypothetical protein IPM99_26105 [Rubrivivax sp.]|nr:hypothetical protein [Rubrivivax sp.]